MNLKEQEWDMSYLKKNNFMFYPHEEIIRFSAKYVAKRIGLNTVEYIVSKESEILDLGCGIGRHVIFFEKMGLKSYGIDLSKEAISMAQKFLEKENIEWHERLFVGSAENLPWEEEKFDYIVSHGVLDSMPYEIAKNVVKECHRVIKKDGIFYCDLIGGDNRHGEGFEDEVVVEGSHEKGTIQSYFTLKKIKELFDGYFEVTEIKRTVVENCITGEFHTRYHAILKKATFV